MGRQRNHHSPELKARVAMEAVKEQRTMNEIASEYGVHPGLISRWKKQLLENAVDLFSGKKELRQRADEGLKEQLYQEIGQLKVELDWLKKRQGISVNQRRLLIDPMDSQISLSRQWVVLENNNVGE